MDYTEDFENRVINTIEVDVEGDNIPECIESCELKDSFLDSNLEKLKKVELEDTIKELEEERDKLIAPINEKIKTLYMKIYFEEFLRKIGKTMSYGNS